MTDIRASYSAADYIPPKLFLNAEGVTELLPVHVQWMPTNICNRNCTFCSCRDRNKQATMPIDKSLTIIRELAQLGCKTVTITGGGEPLCHPGLSDMLRQFKECGISIGLVSNGFLLDKLEKHDFSKMVWCRISCSDEQEVTPKWLETIEGAINRGPLVDWAFSYVVSPHPNYRRIRELVEFANDEKFTHVRLVADLFNAQLVDLDRVRQYLSGIDKRVIYQHRDRPTPSKTCVIGYIKPVIDPNFDMYLCCGAQYALDNGIRDMPKQLRMGSAFNLREIYGPERKT